MKKIITVPEIPTVAVVPFIQGVRTVPTIASQFAENKRLIEEMARVAAWTPGDTSSLGVAADTLSPIRSVR